ncbi:MAG TPA: L-2-hydroxyglutarate oxidase [Acidimicrobiales bacterium]|nr:L-2-hydroxyglutarate oxidase [Acidimicrobiales bacterium]
MSRAGPQTLGVVGGGIVGLALARHLVLARPGLRVWVLEKERAVALHQSGRNSGVVHAGLYYKPGSLKATLCRRGSSLLKEYCRDKGIACPEVGKVVVATGPEELGRLDALEGNARQNQVPGLARLDRAGLAEVEPEVQGLAALHSPHTAVVDFAEVARSLAEDLARAGGELVLGAEVRSLRQEAFGVEVATPERTWSFDLVVACAGLGSDHLARAAGHPGEVRTVPFRGQYFRLTGGAAKAVRGLVYPVPDPRYPFLGVHLTRTVHGPVIAGPNAVVALAVEGYRPLDVRPAELARYLAWPGFWRMAAAHWRTGAAELWGSLSKRAFLARVRRFLPGLQPSELAPWPSGVRAQAVRRSGELCDDFVVEACGRVVLVRNAPSPAATSSLAIAEHLAGVALGQAFRAAG